LIWVAVKSTVVRQQAVSAFLRRSLLLLCRLSEKQTSQMLRLGCWKQEVQPTKTRIAKVQEYIAAGGLGHPKWVVYRRDFVSYRNVRVVCRKHSRPTRSKHRDQIIDACSIELQSGRRRCGQLDHHRLAVFADGPFRFCRHVTAPSLFRAAIFACDA
jgi:hypothetical protein